MQIRTTTTKKVANLFLKAMHGLFLEKNSWEYFSTATVMKQMQTAPTGITYVSVIVIRDILCTMDTVFRVKLKLEINVSPICNVPGVSMLEYVITVRARVRTDIFDATTAVIQIMSWTLEDVFWIPNAAKLTTHNQIADV